MFSRRTGWHLEANEISAALDRRRRDGLPTLDLAESNPTVVGLDPAPLVLPAVGIYDPRPMGLASAREAVSRICFGGKVTPDRVFLSASTSETYAWLLKLLCDPGDELLVPTPSYPLFDYLAGLETVRPVPYRLVPEDGWRIDFSSLVAGVDSRTRAVVVVSPGNPLGNTLHADELGALGRLCQRYGLALICDEVFTDWRHDGAVSSVAGFGACLTFALGGLSKSALVPQAKVAWTGVSGPQALVDDALARIEVIADTYLSVGSPVQEAVSGLLERKSALQQPLRERMARNLATLRSVFAGTAATLVEPAGGWTAVVKLPRTRSETAWVLGLLDDGVSVLPGHFFDFQDEAFVVVSLIVEEAVMRAGASRISERVAREP